MGLTRVEDGAKKRLGCLADGGGLYHEQSYQQRGAAWAAHARGLCAVERLKAEAPTLRFELASPAYEEPRRYRRAPTPQLGVTATPVSRQRLYDSGESSCLRSPTRLSSPSIGAPARA